MSVPKKMMSRRMEYALWGLFWGGLASFIVYGSGDCTWRVALILGVSIVQGYVAMCEVNRMCAKEDKE